MILNRPKRRHWDEGESIDYEDTKTTPLRAQLHSINAWLAKADITFDAKAYDHPVDVHARQLDRQFTLGNCESHHRSKPRNSLYEEEVLHGDEVPDAALELAGSKLWEGPAASATISFCSGLDSCPSSPPKI